MRIISGKARGTKLYTLDGDNTRPTLDRIKEPLFNILQFDLEDAVVLDLFAGSGALGLEALSRGASKAIFCDKNRSAIEIIKKNVEKTKLVNESVIINDDFKDALRKLKFENIKCDLIFIDPPYKTNFVKESLEEILSNDILKTKSIIVVETDEPERIEKDISDLEFEIYDKRKYGRVSLFFLNRKG